MLADWVFPLVYVYAVAGIITAAVSYEVSHYPMRVAMAMGVIWPVMLVITIIRGWIDYVKGLWNGKY